MWLAALAARDVAAVIYMRLLEDWIAYASDHRPLCLGCDVTFSRHSLPTDWAMLLPCQGAPKMAMLSGICSRCSGKSDRELMDAALRDLSTIWPDLRRISVAAGAGHA